MEGAVMTTLHNADIDEPTQTRTTEPLAATFARAVAAKDLRGVGDLLHPEVDFRGMTPGRVWDADGPEDVLAALGTWFDDGDVIEGIESLETDAFADRERVGYRLRVRNEDGLHLVEQQAYLSEREGRIGWLRIMCAGYRPVTDALKPAPERHVRVRVPRSRAPENAQ
jgi:hypothetical protein